MHSPTTSYPATNLAAGTYYWQVRANGTTLADGGTWWSFTVPVVFVKQAPASGTTWVPASAWTTWTSAGNAGYWICVDQTNNASCDTMWYPVGGGTSKLLENPSPGTYYWQIKAQIGSDWAEANGGVWWSFTVGPPPGTSFVKTTPANGTTLGGATAYLGWNASGAPGYEVCWDTTNDGACNTTWQAVGTATSLTVANLQTTTYYWQVRAAGTLADGGTWWSFTVPAHVSKVSPGNGAGVPNNSYATWSLLDSNTAYRVCWSTTNGTCDSMWWPNGGGYQMMFNLVPGVTYYWPFDCARSARSGPP